MAAFGMTLYPYMNARGLTTEPTRSSGAISFAYSGTVVVKYGVETAGTNKLTDFVVYGMGKWGGLPVSHAPVLMIVDAYPGTFVTYGSEALMKADTSQPYGSDPGGIGGGTFGKVGTEYWFYAKQGSWGPIWIPVRQKTAAGTATIEGVACDLYTVSIDVADFPELLGESMDADEYFELCWAMNGRHSAQGWDAIFYLTPTGYKLHGDIMGRTEMNTPVAGEKARYEDEFVTGGQLEAGNGITLRYRTEAGVATGYATVASKGFNFIIESQGVLGVRESVVSGLNLATGAAITWTTGTAYTPINEITYANDLEWVLDATYARTAGITGSYWSPSESIPVIFDIVEDPSGKARVMARTLHSGLWVSHDDGATVTEYGATPNGTVQHIQFEDTASVTFSITDGPLVHGTNNRYGVIVTATGYAGWRISDDALDFDLITTNEEVQFVGLKGVTTNLVLGTPNQLEISRPLQIQDQDVNVGNDSTVTLNFEDGTNTTAVVTDDGSGKRTVVINSTGGGASTPLAAYKAHWYMRADSEYQDGVSFGAFDAGDFHHYLNVGPCGMFTDATYGTARGAFQEIVSAYSTEFSYATTGSPLYKPWSEHWIPRPLRVELDAVYHIDIAMEGIHSRLKECGMGGIGSHRMDVMLMLLVNRGGILYTHQFHDRYQWVQVIGNGATYGNSTPIGELQRKWGYGDSVPWSLQGSCDIYLHADDEILMLVGWNTGVYYWNANDQSTDDHGDIRRRFWLNYYTFNIHQVNVDGSQGAPWSGGLVLHALSDMANAGRPSAFESMEW